MKEKKCTLCGKIKCLFDFYKSKKTKDKHRSRCKECYKKLWHFYGKQWNKEHLNHIQNYKKRNKVKRNNQRNQRKKDDIDYRIFCNLRVRLSKAIRKNQKFGYTIKLLGCSIEQLKQHLEKQFTKGMNWDNYGFYGWHIDHIKPCCSFDFSKPIEQFKCFNYRNLQPLWAKENISKGNKIIK